MHHPRQTIGTPTLFLLAAALTACLGPGEPVEPLEGTEWVLTALNGAPLVEGSRITLNFTGDEAEGFAGCNRYGGKYTARGAGSLQVPEVVITVMLCLSPEGVMEQEKDYVGVLSSAAAYRIVDDRLEIENASGETSLVFARQAEFPMNPGDLVGAEWQLISLNGRPPVEGSTLTLAFHNEREVGGRAGCRNYRGTYEASGDDIRFTSFQMEELDCMGPRVFLAQEGEYTDSLGWATDFRLSDGQLEILTARGEVLTYAPLPPGTDTSPKRIIWAFAAFVEGETTSPSRSTPSEASGPLAGTEITLTFEGGVLNQRGTVSGSAGCNTYSAAYVFDGSFLAFEAPVMTEKFCGDPSGLMEQEQRYLDFLKDITVYRIDGNQLSLETGDGRALVFTVQN